MGVDPTGATNLMFKFFLLSIIILLLPDTPYQSAIAFFRDVPYLSYINWFVPIHQFAVMFESLLAVLLTYYGYMIVMRFVNLIKGGD